MNTNDGQGRKGVVKMFSLSVHSSNGERLLKNKGYSKCKLLGHFYKNVITHKKPTDRKTLRHRKQIKNQRTTSMKMMGIYFESYKVVVSKVTMNEAVYEAGTPYYKGFYITR